MVCLVDARGRAPRIPHHMKLFLMHRLFRFAHLIPEVFNCRLSAPVDGITSLVT